MANMHTQRWQRAKQRVGYGHLYQGRFKSFPVETDEHFYTVVRYVERNASACRPRSRPEVWPWGSLTTAFAWATFTTAGRLASATTLRLA